MGRGNDGEGDLFCYGGGLWGEAPSELRTCSCLSLEVANAAKVSAQEIEDEVLDARRLFEKEPENQELIGRMSSAEYEYSKYVRTDNRGEYARYLGYLDARELYPDLQPKKFWEFVQDLLDGKVRRPYSGVQ